MKLKYKLPNYAKLENKFDIEKLKKSVLELEHLFTNVYDANGKLCASHHKLATDVHTFFDQINLTTNDNLEKISTEQCMELLETNSVKNRIRENVTDSGIDEKSYNIPTPQYVNSYFQEVVESFKADAIRVRITKLGAGKSLIPHIDYDPSYAVRIIVPIFSDKLCVNQFYRKNVLEEVHLEADGSAYFLNTGVKHSVVNNSSSDRIALMVSLNNTFDIEHLINE